MREEVSGGSLRIYRGPSKRTPRLLGPRAMRGLPPQSLSARMTPWASTKKNLAYASLARFPPKRPEAPAASWRLYVSLGHKTAHDIDHARCEDCISNNNCGTRPARVSRRALHRRVIPCTQGTSAAGGLSIANRSGWRNFSARLILLILSLCWCGIGCTYL